jgi:uncharacterized protein (DUF1697 family)
VPRKPLEVHVALLRGVNVGGKNKLPMKQLVAIFAGLGADGAQSYIQSGNVVYRASPALARRIPAAVSAAIASELGLAIPVVTRSLAELRAVAAGNPFLERGVAPTAAYVAFLADTPTAARVAALDPQRSPGDAFAVRGRDIYLHLPNGGGRSKLTAAFFDSKLATISTARNWRTVLTLLEMAEAAAAA